MKRNIVIALASEDYVVLGEAKKYKKFFDYAAEYELIDRLYRKYVRYEDTEKTQQLSNDVFEEISFDRKLRQKFTNAYNRCKEQIETYAERNGKYYVEGDKCPPIRIINVTGVETDQITDQMPSFMAYLSAESEIPLEDYDNLEGNPFWMRPEYVVEKYL